MSVRRDNLNSFLQFFVFVLIIFIVEIVGAILVFVYFPEVETYALKSISAYNSSTIVRQGWDTFQANVRL